MYPYSVAILFIVATGVAYPLRVSLAKGSGRREFRGNFGPVADEACQVGITWVAVNTPILHKYMVYRGGKPRVLLHSARENITVASTMLDSRREGPSLGACIGLAVICCLTNRELVADIGVTGELDLRGRITSVSGLVGKAAGAKELGLDMVIIPADDYRELKTSDFSAFEDEELRDYVRGTFHGASNMVEVLQLAVKGERSSAMEDQN